MDSISGISALNNLLAYNKSNIALNTSDLTREVEAARTDDPVEALSRTQDTQSNSQIALLQSATGGADIYGNKTPAPSYLSNISSLSLLSTINQINALGQTSTGKPYEIYGSSAQAAATGLQWQADNTASLYSSLFGDYTTPYSLMTGRSVNFRA